MIKSIVCLSLFLCFSTVAKAQDDTSDIVIGQVHQLESAILGETRNLKVWLPESYSDSSKTYPVLYLLDAEMVMRFAKAAATVAEFGGSRVPEMIVIGIENTDRNRDMFPGEGADSFLNFLASEFFPFVEAGFRTNSYRILTGHSNSALFVSYALLKRPEVFNAYFAISPMLGWREQEMLELARQSFADFPERNTFLYIEYGDQDYDRVINVVPKFIEILESANPAALDHRLDILPGEGHVPYSCYRDALLALFPDFLLGEADLAQGLEHIEKHYRGLSSRYGFSIETPAESLVEYARLVLDQGDHEKAIEALNLASTRYPDSATPLYWLGRAYEAVDKLPEALATYKRFLELYPNSTRIKAKVTELENTIEAK